LTLDWQTAIEIGRAFPFLEADRIAGDQRIDEGMILCLIHGAVDVVLAVATRAHLVVAGLVPANIHVDAVAMDDRCDRVEERQRIFACLRLDGGGKLGRGERACGDDRVAPFLRREARHNFANNGNEWMRLKLSRNRFGKAIAVDGESAAGRNLVLVGAGHNKRARETHFRMNDTDGIGRRIVGTEGVGADQLRKTVTLVSIRAANAAHFVQDDGDASLGDLPGRFRAGKAAANDVDGRVYIVLHRALTLPTGTKGAAGRPSFLIGLASL